MLTLSLIIPVYNEERHIKECLEAIAAQTVAPNEVIVVDNNCTDQTIKIAKTFPFVTVIREKTPGLIAARNAGFAAASGDILGRIDADSVIEPNWVSVVMQQFSDKSLGGLSGFGYTSVMHYMTWPKSLLFSRLYHWYAEFSFGQQMMWGANMALRADAWDEIKDFTEKKDDAVHEDQDISILLVSKTDFKQQLCRDMLISTPGQTYRYFPKLIYYWKLQQMTKWRHRWRGNLKPNSYRFRVKTRLIPRMVLAAPFGLALMLSSALLLPFDLLMTKLDK